MASVLGHYFARIPAMTVTIITFLIFTIVHHTVTFLILKLFFPIITIMIVITESVRNPSTFRINYMPRPLSRQIWS